MEEYEVYNKYFTDEEYNLEEAPNELYSYRAGWNDALKRAAIVVRHDIPSKGKWKKVNPLQENDGGAFMCSCCKVGSWDYSNSYHYCPNCGAQMER